MCQLKNLLFLIILLGLKSFTQELGEVVVYNTNNSGLNYNQINCLEFDNDNRLWIGTENGLNIFDEINNNWSAIYTNSINSPTPWSSLPSNVITALEWDNFEEQPNMFIGTIAGITNVWWEIGEFNSSGEEWSWIPNFGDECSPNNGVINTILHNNNADQIWVGSTDGLCVENLGGEGSWLVQNTQNDFYSNNITSIVHSINTDMIGIGTMNGGLITYDDEFNIYYSSNSDILDNTVLDLAFDQNNNIILCTPQAGLGVFTQGGSWIWFNTINSDLPTNSLQNLVVDNNNNLWITTLEDGLIQYVNNTFYHYTTDNSELPDNSINCLKIGPDNHLWLGTETGGVVKINTPETSIIEQNSRSTHIWPNTFNNNINIQLDEYSIITIVNPRGQLIATYKFNPGFNNINTTNYMSGLYLIRIESQGHRSIKKMIKP